MSGKLVVDNVHGDIHLTEEEWRIVDTPVYQRLRNLKQLQMGHLTYPNATHTRFAHSLGVLAVMNRVLSRIREVSRITGDQVRHLRLAALLHDIGHYPYSHLMEKVDKVVLTEEFVSRENSVVIHADQEAYPDHEEVGGLILAHQKGLGEILGGTHVAERVANLFRRTKDADAELSKLIHSSLDMDRLDYLLRDSQATGVPYGRIDIDYILNNVQVSPKGALGVNAKALSAAEHFLLARLYMYRTVYWHKTTFAFEEACKQLLRRIRQDGKLAGKYGLAKDGAAIRELVTSRRIGEFTDGYVDRIIQKAAHNKDPVIGALARCISGRRAPKLLKEVTTFSDQVTNSGTQFRQACQYELKPLAEKFGIPLGQFLFAETKPMKLEERAALMTSAEADKRKSGEREELIKVFLPGKLEPVSMVEIEDSPIAQLARKQFCYRRLYLVCDSQAQATKLNSIRDEVSSWG